MRILFLTDLHATAQYLPLVVAREAGAELVLLGGDITNFGGADQARHMVAPLREAFGTVAGVPGNVDRHGVLHWLLTEGLSLHGSGRDFGGVWISGCGGSNLTPLHSPMELPEPTLEGLLEAGVPPPGFAGPWILVSHVPPSDTRCDRMHGGRHVGSSALRAFLERRRPALCLCGHIHEAVAEDRVGETPVVNPGAFTSRRYGVVQVDGDRVRTRLEELPVSPLSRLRAEGAALATKVWGYARHRLGR